MAPKKLAFFLSHIAAIVTIFILNTVTRPLCPFFGALCLDKKRHLLSDCLLSVCWLFSESALQNIFSLRASYWWHFHEITAVPEMMRFSGWYKIQDTRSRSLQEPLHHGRQCQEQEHSGFFPPPYTCSNDLSLPSYRQRKRFSLGLQNVCYCVRT